MGHLTTLFSGGADPLSPLALWVITTARPEKGAAWGGSVSTGLRTGSRPCSLLLWPWERHHASVTLIRSVQQATWRVVSKVVSAGTLGEFHL